MTSKRRNKNWILVAVAVAVPVMVIVGLRVAARVEEWPVELGANTMEQVKGKPLTLYSCDNVARLAGTPCHEAGSPDFMMVVLHEEPAGAPSVRFPDPGAGVPARTLELRFLGGTVWVKAEADGGQGWIERGYTR
jgi:hypothetical protein